MSAKVLMIGVSVIVVAVGFWLVVLRADDSDPSELAAFLESRTLDGQVYPVFLPGEGSDDIDRAGLMYGYAQSLLAVAGLQNEQYDQMSAEVGEYLDTLDDFGDGTDALTAGLLVGLPEVGNSDTAREYLDGYLNRLVVDPEIYQTYADLSKVARTRFWVTQDVAIDAMAVGIPPPSCSAVQGALDDGQLEAIGPLVVVDPTIRTRCGHAESPLDSVLVDASPGLFVEVMALRESGWITEDAFNQFHADFDAAVGRFHAWEPFFAPLGVALGLIDPGDARVLQSLQAVSTARASGHLVGGLSAVSTWRMQDIARLAGSDLSAEPELIPGGLTGVERAVFQIMGHDVEGIPEREGENPELALHYWIIAIDYINATGTCDGLEDIGPDPSTPLVVEAYDYIVAICGPNFATFDGPAQHVAKISEPSADLEEQFERAVSRSLRCRLGLPTAAPQPRTEPYPSFLFALWVTAVLTDDCA